MTAGHPSTSHVAVTIQSAAAGRVMIDTATAPIAVGSNAKGLSLFVPRTVLQESRSGTF
jgi:hypothetical protein